MFSIVEVSRAQQHRFMECKLSTSMAPHLYLSRHPLMVFHGYANVLILLQYIVCKCQTISELSEPPDHSKHPDRRRIPVASQESRSCPFLLFF